MQSIYENDGAVVQGLGKRCVTTCCWGGARKRGVGKGIELRYIHKDAVEARNKLLTSLGCQMNNLSTYPVDDDLDSDDEYMDE